MTPITLEQAIRIATRRILPEGFKPEDYLFVDERVPVRIAIMIVKEAHHLVKISKHYWVPNGSESKLL